MIRTSALCFVFSLLLAGVFLSPLTWASHWPSERRRTMIERWEANAIFYVEIVESKLARGGQVAHLKILKVIKPSGREGQAAGEEVEVFVQLGSDWPYSFPNSGKAIAFLKFDEKQKCYIPFFRREAGLNVDEKVGELYVQQYAKLSRVLKEKNPRRLLEKKLQWNIEFTGQPTARSEAAHGIKILWSKACKNPVLKLTKDELDSPVNLLNDLQKKRICDLFANEVPSFESCSLLEIMAEHPSTEIDSYLVSALKRSLEFESAVPVDYICVAELSMELLPSRMGFEATPALVDRYDAFQEQRSDFTYLIDVGEEKSKAEKLEARAAVIETWRKLTTDFLVAVDSAQKEKSSTK